MATTEEQLQVAITNVENIRHDLRAAYCNCLALRDFCRDKQNQFHALLSQHPAPNPLHIPNSGSYTYRSVCLSSVSEFLTIKGALELLEGSDEFQNAAKIVQPLVDEVRRLELKLADEINSAALARAERNDRIEAAKAAAIAEIEAQFALPEQEAPKEDTKPFRGKVKREPLAVEQI